MSTFSTTICGLWLIRLQKPVPSRLRRYTLWQWKKEVPPRIMFPTARNWSYKTAPKKLTM